MNINQNISKLLEDAIIPILAKAYVYSFIPNMLRAGYCCDIEKDMYSDILKALSYKNNKNITPDFYMDYVVFARTDVRFVLHYNKDIPNILSAIRNFLRYDFREYLYNLDKSQRGTILENNVVYTSYFNVSEEYPVINYWSSIYNFDFYVAPYGVFEDSLKSDRLEFYLDNLDFINNTDEDEEDE